MNDIESMLAQHGYTIEDLLKYINEKGGRQTHKPIIVKEICQKCTTLFFSNVQDHEMRLRGGWATRCPSCRDEERKEIEGTIVGNIGKEGDNNGSVYYVGHAPVVLPGARPVESNLRGSSLGRN